MMIGKVNYRELEQEEKELRTKNRYTKLLAVRISGQGG